MNSNYVILSTAFEYVNSHDLDSLVKLYTQFPDQFDINALDPEYKTETLLFNAVQAQAKKIVSFLLYHGADPHTLHPQYDNQTPLGLAKKLATMPLYSRHYILVLLDSDIDANAVVPGSMRGPLMHAIGMADVYAVRYLLERRGARLNAEALEIALVLLDPQPLSKSVEIVRVLLHHGADIAPMAEAYPDQVQWLKALFVGEARRTQPALFEEYAPWRLAKRPKNKSFSNL
jgi:hypothetical protein